MATNLLYEDLTYEVIGCAFEAFKEVGVGFEELIYHKVFHEYLLEKGLKAHYKHQIRLDYRSRKIGKTVRQTDFVNGVAISLQIAFEILHHHK